MNILYLTMSRIDSLSERDIYTDLFRYFRDRGHQVWLVSPRERSTALQPGMRDVDGVHILGVRTLNLQKTSVIEKGIGQVLVGYQYGSAIRKYLKDVSFDLILYSTPPITLTRAIRLSKRWNPGAGTYLLLKDIFPQNAVDIGMLSKSGIKGLLYKYFRRKEKKLYRISDYIGCMSQANVDYVLAHNPEIPPQKVEIAPNSILLQDPQPVDKGAVRARYGVPEDRPVFIYGGNLGKPQGIPFLLACLQANADRQDCFFVVVVNGTEYPKLKKWYDEAHTASVLLLERLPKAEYDAFVASCDVGLVFLDHRFTIPNFPSRLLSYLEQKMPVLCAVDPHTDMGRIAQENEFGYWCESDSVASFNRVLDKMIRSDRASMGEKGYQYMKTHYLVEHTYDAIVRHV